jgi:oligopeptide transport system substrate-binding protein
MKLLYTLLIVLVTCSGCYQKSKTNHNHLRINFQEGDLPSLHPHDLVIYLRGLSIAKTLFEPLTRINAEGKVELAGAESVSVSDDRLHYTFKLRENRWSDGTPVTAHHYVAAWQSALAPTSPCSRAELLYVFANGQKAKKGEVAVETTGIKAVDDKTLVVDLEFPTPYFLELMAQCIAAPLINPEDHNLTCFNGPFMVETWKKGDRLTLKPNPYYWDKAHVYLKQIDVYFIEDINTVFALYSKGDLDWVGVPLAPLSVELIQHLQAAHQLKSHPIGRSFWVFLNTEHPALSSIHIRQALSLAIDRAAITNHILIGGQPSVKPLSTQLLPVLQGVALKEDPQLALSYLQAGLTELGLTRETLPPLEITYSQQSCRKQVAEYLQETWHKQLGIDVRLRAMEWNVLRTNLAKGLFTISMAYEGAFYKDPLELLERYATRNPSNFSQWLNTEFARILATAKYESNTSRRTQILSEAELVLMEQMPFIPICSDRVLFAHSPTLLDYVIDSIGAIDFTHASNCSVIR